MKRYDSVEHYVQDLANWQEEVMRLREVVLSTNLTETLKWSMPVYTSKNGKNVIGIFAPKDYFGLWFYQGALLSDPEGVLVNAQEGKTKALRQWRFTNKREIKVRSIKKYIAEANELAEAGKEIKPNRAKPVVIPPELRKALNADKKIKSLFEKMSKSCRREFADYIREAKKPETKSRRIAKIIPMISKSVGLNDKYR
jgi:uncharacterized protein YdeI (YjbR/CyaY-like superfamily)